MDNLIKKLVKEFVKENKNVDNEEKEISKECKIVAKVNKKGDVEVLEIEGQQIALLSTICAILKVMAKYSDDSAERLAMTILTALKMEKELND